MSLGCRNPKVTAKPRTKPLARTATIMSAWSGCALVWIKQAPHPTAQLSLLEEYYFPGLGWGRAQALQYISVLIMSHKFFSFIDILKYARNIEMPPKSTERPLWPRISQNDSTFCASSPLPFRCHRQFLSSAQTAVRDFQPHNLLPNHSAPCYSSSFPPPSLSPFLPSRNTSHLLCTNIWVAMR